MSDPLTILTGAALTQLRTLPDESVHCCVTSPPYWGLRDYGTAEWEGGDTDCDHLETNDLRDPKSCKQTSNARTSQLGFRESCKKCGAKRIDQQLGLEKTPDEYVAKMVEIFHEVRRVLRKDGTLWLNLGDSYAGSWGNYHPDSPPGKHGQRLKETARWNRPAYQSQEFLPPTANCPGLKPKDLCGIPWRMVFALQADSWWLRQDIIWSKPNPMPESVTDRCTKAHEYVFLLTKSARYFYDAEAIKEGKAYSTLNDDRTNDNGHRRMRDYPGAQTNGGTNLGGPEGNRNKRSVWSIDDHQALAQWLTENEPDIWARFRRESRNKKDVWNVAAAPYPKAHFATYPPDLIKPMIMAGTSAKGCCVKCGSPWERIVESEKSFQSGSGRAGNMPNGKQDLRASDTNSTPDVRLGPCVTTKTLGWHPICKCDPLRLEHDLRPCTVLDPFAGSGTTGAVALELGRKAILIELNPKYVDLIKQRCNITPGLALAV